MDFTKDALQYLVDLREPTIHKDDQGRAYSDTELHDIKPDCPDPVVVSTLSGVKDLLQTAVEKLKPAEVLVLVRSHEHVSVVSKCSDLWGRRQSFAEAKLPQLKSFKFGNFLDHEEFLISVMAMFANTADRDYLVQIASHIGTEKVRTSLDDGVSQEITLKTGASLKTSAKINNRLMLAPFRTFREIEQPASEFLFRLRGGNDQTPPTLALFESDGGKWQLDAMESIGRYFRSVVSDETAVVI